MALYHFEIGFPQGFVSRIGTVGLNYTQHALNAANTDRYGRLPLPKSIDTNKAICIEAEIDGGHVLKLVYRMQLTIGLDLIIVVVPCGLNFKVKTVWANLSTDKHSTLNRSRYETPAA
jgi:hypothetical protein